MRKLTLGVAALLLLVLLNGGKNAYAVLVSSSSTSNNDKTSKLVSDSSATEQTSGSLKTASSEAPVPPGKVRLKFKPKTQPAPYVAQKEAAIDVVKKTEMDEEDIELGISKTMHQASAKPDAVNPFVQTVNGPKTVDYSKVKTAHVQDKQEGSPRTFSIKGSAQSS